MKRLSTLLLAVTMVLGSTVATMAEDTQPEESTTPETVETLELTPAQRVETETSTEEETETPVEVKTEVEAAPMVNLLTVPENEDSASGENGGTGEDAVNQQQNPEPEATDTKDVSDWEEFKEALGVAQVKTINLTGDIQASEKIVIKKDLTINLNSHSITATTKTSGNLIATDDGANLVINGSGTLSTNTNSSNVVAVNGGSLALNNVVLDNSTTGANGGAPLIVNSKGEGKTVVSATNVTFKLASNSWYGINVDDKVGKGIDLTLTGCSFDNPGSKRPIDGEKTTGVNVTVDGTKYYPLVDTTNDKTTEYGIPNVKVGNEYYRDLAVAIEKAPADATVEVLKSCELSKPVTVNNNLTIVGGEGIVVTAGYTGTTGNQTMLTSTSGELTVENLTLKGSPKYGVQAYEAGSVVLKSVNIENPGYGGVLLNGGKGTLKNVNVNGDKPAVELAKGSGVESNPILDPASTIGGDNNGLYIDDSQFGDMPKNDYDNMISNLSDIAKNNGLALTDTDSTIVAEPSVPAEQPKEEEKKTPATYDDGGPFTTDANGNVYDRWGNEIWHNPVQTNNGKSVSGFQLVNTSDR